MEQPPTEPTNPAQQALPQQAAPQQALPQQVTQNYVAPQQAAPQPGQANYKVNPKHVVMLLAIPATLIVLAIGFIAVPRVLANPGHDFLYSYCDAFDCDTEFRINGDGEIYETGTDDGFNNRRSIELRYYDVSEDSWRKITIAEANKLDLDNSSKSPDGYKLDTQYSENVGIFSGSSSTTLRLEKGLLNKPIEIDSDESYYYQDNYELLGWVNK